MFNAALFTIAKTWKQPKCSSAEEWKHPIKRLNIERESLLLSGFQLFGDPLNSSPPGFSNHGISQARIQEWFTFSFSRGFSQPSDHICMSCLADISFTAEWPRKPSGILLSHKRTKQFHLQQQGGVYIHCYTEWSKSDSVKWISYGMVYM